jgi:hypothetical protein
MSSLPSEEEQMEMLRLEEAWNIVTTKKSTKGKKKEPVSESVGESEPIVSQLQPTVPVTSQPATKAPNTNGNGKPAKPFYQQSSFAALSTNEPESDEAPVEEEWDV